MSERRKNGLKEFTKRRILPAAAITAALAAPNLNNTEYNSEQLEVSPSITQEAGTHSIIKPVFITPLPAIYDSQPAPSDLPYSELPAEVFKSMQTFTSETKQESAQPILPKEDTSSRHIESPVEAHSEAAQETIENKPFLPQPEKSNDVYLKGLLIALGTALSPIVGTAGTIFYRNRPSWSEIRENRRNRKKKDVVTDTETDNAVIDTLKVERSIIPQNQDFGSEASDLRRMVKQMEGWEPYSANADSTDSTDRQSAPDITKTEHTLILSELTDKEKQSFASMLRPLTPVEEYQFDLEHERTIHKQTLDRMELNLKTIEALPERWELDAIARDMLDYPVTYAQKDQIKYDDWSREEWSLLPNAYATTSIEDIEVVTKVLYGKNSSENVEKLMAVGSNLYPESHEEVVYHVEHGFDDEGNRQIFTDAYLAEKGHAKWVHAYKRARLFEEKGLRDLKHWSEVDIINR